MPTPNVELHRKWEARIADFRASGLSGAKWCEKHGFRKKQFYYWLAKFKDTVAQPETQTQWLQVELDEPENPVNAIEVKVGKAVIELKPGFDPQLLAAVVHALELC